jgi:anti-sigma B factor antagonist
VAGPDLRSSAPADGVVLVTVRGEHDIASAPDLRGAIEQALSQSQHVVVDLTPATFIDSTVLGVLLGARGRAEEEEVGYAVVLEAAGGDPAVRRVLEVTGLQDLLPVHRDRDAAVKLVAAAPADPGGGPGPGAPARP